jgi:hypothetical protein
MMAAVAGEEQSDVDEVLGTIQKTLDDNAMITVQKGQAEAERAAALAKERAHAEQERVSKRMSMETMQSIGDMPESSEEEEEEESHGEVVWEGVRDGKMM